MIRIFIQMFSNYLDPFLGMLSIVKHLVEMYETLLNLILIWKAIKENALTNQSKTCLSAKVE